MKNIVGIVLIISITCLINTSDQSDDFWEKDSQEVRARRLLIEQWLDDQKDITERIPLSDYGSTEQADADQEIEELVQRIETDAAFVKAVLPSIPNINEIVEKFFAAHL